MAGNTLGKLFTVTTFGESHGDSIGCVIDGCPPGMDLSVKDIQPALDKRRPNVNKYTSSRQELDLVEILSGVFQGKTTGTPIALKIKNQDHRSTDYTVLADKFRPGHADYTYYKKYGIRDYRGGGRASARETAMRVAAGAIAAKYLQQNFDVTVISGLKQIGQIQAENLVWQDLDNPFSFLDATKVTAIEDLFAQLKLAGDSVGAKAEVLIQNIPAGLGEPVFDKLDADLAKAWMSINAVKAVGFGLAEDFAGKFGSESRDAMCASGFVSDFAGGILGGISTGQDISGSITFKPTSSIRSAIKTIDINHKEQDLQVFGRHDPCVAIRATAIINAMSSIVVLDHLLRHRAQNYDNLV